MIDNEIPKYRKKKKSSTSKSSKKSKHKHNYIECLLIYQNKPHRATYCKICGKIGNMSLFEDERQENGLYRQLGYNEVFKRYSNLERIEVESLFQKYIPITKK